MEPSSSSPRSLSRGRAVKLTRVRDDWRILGASGDGLFFLAELAHEGLPSGIVKSQLTAADMHRKKIIDGKVYTVTAHGGAVEMDPSRGYTQRSN